MFSYSYLVIFPSTCRPDLTFVVDWALNNNDLSQRLCPTFVRGGHVIIQRNFIDSVLAQTRSYHSIPSFAAALRDDAQYCINEGRDVDYWRTLVLFRTEVILFVLFVY